MSDTQPRPGIVENLTGGHTPDILDTLANLSNDEVFTPPDLANQILDLLPEEVWSNPDLRFLDPAVKTGVFLREAAKRLMDGLADVIPDEEERRRHIFHDMLYGLAITELTSLLGRRSLYYTTHARNSDLSVVPMPSDDGNIHYARINHTYENGSCVYCGASQKVHDRGSARESHAYAFIHPDALPAQWKENDMKFDVIIGNPPYQIKDGGHGAGASPLYHLFVQGAKALDPRYITMITPSRWFAGGKGLDEFREEMLNDQRVSRLVDIPNAGEAFPGVEIKGGVCYFLWDAHHGGDCAITTVSAGAPGATVARSLSEWDVLVRFNEAAHILRKVQDHSEPTMETVVSSQKPFGLRTNFRGVVKKPGADAVRLFQNGGQAWVKPSQIEKNSDWVGRWKVLTSMGYGAGEGYPHQITGQPILSPPGSACTETYLVLGPVADETEATRLAGYIKTKFVRFLISLRKNTQHLSQSKFTFVPAPDLSRTWTDADLYAKYALTKDEIAYIEAQIKDMP